MQILYAHHVLGYSMKELAALTGRERRDPLGPPGPRPPSAPRVIQGATGMSVAYRVQVGGWRSGGLRRRAAAGSPNWWVILAVTLALMALLVGATGAPRPPHVGRALHGVAASDAPTSVTRARGGGDGTPSRTSAPRPRTSKATTRGTAATTSTTVAPNPGAVVAALEGSSSPQAHATTSLGPSGTTSPTPTTTTTTAAPTAPTTNPGPVAADRMETPGYLDPPLQTSNSYSFTGSSAMQIMVEWTGDTYLTMDVTCPSGDQSVGGSSAMQAFLAGAGGSCTATVSEPSSENVPLTYTITIGPTGG